MMDPRFRGDDNLTWDKGFTLIELSIVLVIIGLIVGGVLVGRDLIHAAEVRAQITQIEKYNTAVNTFRGKFSALPGDMPMATASQFGFIIGNNCDGSQGQRDGNGLIDGFHTPNTLYEGMGETELFWQDISSTMAGNLIEGYFPNSGGPLVYCGNDTNASALTAIGQYLPVSKLGHGLYVYVYETGGYNWYGVSAVTGLGINIATTATIPVTQAYAMDKKVDDGLPISGVVQAVYIKNSIVVTFVANSSTNDSATSCYNVTNNVYSISSAASYGTGGNCALSFRFQ